MELIDLVNSVIIFLSQSFSKIPDCDSHISAFLDFFLSCLFGFLYLFLFFLFFTLFICSGKAFAPLGSSGHVIVSGSIDFPSNSQWDDPFHRIAYDYCCADWNSLRDHLRDVPWEDMFKLSASAAGGQISTWVQVGIDVYIPHRQYQVRPHSSP